MTFPTAAVATTNLDAGSDNVATARGDLLDAAQKLNLLIAMIAGTEVALAVSGTVDIGGQVSQRIAFTSGSGAITSLGSNYGGPIFVRAAVTCSLTYNATTLVTPNSANMPLRAGDRFMAVPKASGGSADGWAIIPAPWSMDQLGLGGVTPGANATLALGRRDAVSEGGQLDFHRASDNTARYSIDVVGTGADDQIRIIDQVAVAVRFAIDVNGNIGINQSGTLTSPLDIGGNRLRVRTQKTPSSAADTGNQGEWCNDSSYLYICTAANTWKRVAIATW